MRHRFAQRLTPRDFFGKITATRFAIVRVDSGLGLKFNPYLMEHFDDRYPRQFTYGVFDRSRVTDPTWWGENFRTSFGPIVRGTREIESGYYLFEVGAVRAHRIPSTWLDPKASAKQIIDLFDAKVRLGGWSETTSTAREAEAPITSPHVVAGPDPFEVLGVEPDASDQEIKRAYKEQMKLNHPDRVAHLSPAIRKVAEEQTLAIQRAYEAIRAMRRGSGR